jgi:hypothetical protein
MLSLESPRWKELKHAYGVASDTPTLLQQLDTLPDASGQSEPWFTLWSSPLIKAMFSLHHSPQYRM